MEKKSTRWFYSLFMNYDSVSIFESSEYGPKQGYETEKDAIAAAIKAVGERMKERSETISLAVECISKLSQENVKLSKRLMELSK